MILDFYLKCFYLGVPIEKFENLHTSNFWLYNQKFIETVMVSFRNTNIDKIELHKLCNLSFEAIYSAAFGKGNITDVKHRVS